METAQNAEVPSAHGAGGPTRVTGRARETLRATSQATPRATHGGALPLLEIGAGSGLLGALLEIAGATDGGSLQGALAAWQREQDRLANRAWRRPGGMARPAGL